MTSLKRALVRLTFDISSGAVGSELGLLQTPVHHEMNDFCCHPRAWWVMTRSTKNTETSWLGLLQPVEDQLQLTDGPPLLSSDHDTREPQQSTHTEFTDHKYKQILNFFIFYFSQISVKLSLNWENAAAPRQTIDTLWCWTHNKSCKIPKILFWLQRNKMATAVRTNAVVHKPTSGVTTTNRRNSSSCEFMLLTVSPLHAN